MGLSARVVSCQAAQSPHQAGQTSDLTNLLADPLEISATS